MATTRLFLKEPKSKGITRIICVLTDGRETQLKFQTDHSINPRHWGKNQRVHSANTNAVEINKQLDTFKNSVLNIYQTAKAEGLKVNAEFIREQLKPKKKPVNGNAEFWEVWEYHQRFKRNNFKERTILKLKALENHLKRFEAHEKIPLQLKVLSVDTLERLQDYFYKVPNKGAGLNTQTTTKYIEIFKMFLNWTIKHKYSENDGFRDFKPLQQPDSLKVVLTNEEMEKIRKAPLHGKNYLSNVRDLLILSTLTGLRYSDYSRIKTEHLKQDEDGSKTLQIRQQKTNDFIELPLTNEAESIINKLFSGEVHPISNQNMNAYVKELCKAAEVNEPFEVHKFQGNLKVTKRQPKYELITTHTGRRTFATNLMQRGVPALTVMKFTGHRDYKSFTKYVNIPKKAEMDIIKLALMAS